MYEKRATPIHRLLDDKDTSAFKRATKEEKRKLVLSGNRSVGLENRSPFWLSVALRPQKPQAY